MFKRGSIIAIFATLLDQIHKWYMIEVVNISQGSIEITSFFRLVMVWNNGISFGMFQSSPYAQYIFFTLSIIISICMLIWLKKISRIIESYAIGLIIGGALGNAIDRIHYGAVADFFDLSIMHYHWPAFNIADICISLGAAILIIDMLLTKPEEKKQ